MNKELYEILAADIEVLDNTFKYKSLCKTKKYYQAIRRRVRRMYYSKKHPGFRFVYWLRISRFSKKWTFFGFLSRFLFRYYSKKFQVRISCKEIGKGLHIAHVNCYINAEKIGDYFTIYQGATIGFDRGGFLSLATM